MTVGKGTETLIADYEIHAGGGKIPPEVQVVMAGIEVDLNVTTVGCFLS